MKGAIFSLNHQPESNRQKTPGSYIPVIIKALWVFTMIMSIKTIFTDTGFDNTYTVSMSYRHLKGDAMFAEMWEPHQTSIFLTDILLWIYRLVVPSFAGVMIYLQICGTILFAGLSCLLYKLLLPYCNQTVASLGGMFFFVFRAKQTPFPDFANMQIGFSVLLFWALIRFFENQGRKRYLLLAGVFLCLEILSYPSCLIAYFPVVYLLWRYAEDRIRSILLLTGTCAGIGIAYVAYFMIRIGAATFVSNLLSIYKGDSHSDDYISATAYWGPFLYSCLWLLLTLLLAYGITKLLRRPGWLFSLWGILLLCSEAILLIGEGITGLDWTCSIYILPFFLLILGILVLRRLPGEEAVLVHTGALLSVSSIAATALLTDLGMITIVAYGVLMVPVSFVVLKHYKRECLVFMICLCALTIGHRSFVVWGYGNKYQVHNVLQVNNIIRNGPSVGVVCDHMNSYMTSRNAKDFSQYIMPEDEVLLVTEQLLDSCQFLLHGANISNPSTIDTPIYNEQLLVYFERYPHKYPTVVAMECWYGVSMVSPDSWIYQWVEEHYEPVGEGGYWKFYRAKGAS